METLPNELYDAIFAYLTFDDLQRVRLVCHDFAAKAALRLFENVSVWIQKDSLKMWVSLRSILSGHNRY